MSYHYTATKWAKSKTLSTLNTREDMKQHILFVRKQDGPATLEDNLAISIKLNTCLSYDLAIVLPGVCKGVKNRSTQKPAYGCYSSFTHNRQTLEATKIPFGRRIDK